ncbi:hypothetical protein QQP08_009966 [Theobroma cacao]|nr:hypothetical protein QQP08_009966 [Theobroma cacao]
MVVVHKWITLSDFYEIEKVGDYRRQEITHKFLWTFLPCSPPVTLGCLSNPNSPAKGNLTFCFLAEDSSANKSAGKLLQTSGGGGAGSCSDFALAWVPTACLICQCRPGCRLHLQEEICEYECNQNRKRQSCNGWQAGNESGALSALPTSADLTKVIVCAFGISHVS